MAKTPSPRGEDKAMKAKSPPRWGVGSGSSVATGAGQRGGVCPPLGTPAPVRSHCLCCPDGRGGQGHEGQVPIPGAYLKKKLKKKISKIKVLRDVAFFSLSCEKTVQESEKKRHKRGAILWRFFSLSCEKTVQESEKKRLPKSPPSWRFWHAS